jgi:serine/threonine protein kinase/tetratricopeptide (TPR) repeat protein
MNQDPSPDNSCQECGALLTRTAPHGLCSRCLVSNALAMESPAQEGFSLPSPEELNADFPDYEIRRFLGRGGMGGVYEAWQKSLGRSVALKLLPSELLRSQDFFDRFQREARTMALMDHPNVARVFDSGITPDGEAFIVMELISGERVTDYVAGRPLSVRQSLSLFIDVCNGVQHAHQKGVIHRDLKPSNILVAEVGGRPVPKVIDFGLAKPLEQTGGDEAMWLSARHAIGTPAYMSPEQVAGDDIDSRSDVYALGALLFELLTGRTAIDDPKLRDATRSMVEKVIRETPVPKPSDSVGVRQSSAGVPREADLQSPAPHVLQHPATARELKGDLDAIVFKALDKDPARRYQTVAALSDDIERHLTHQPVTAVTPSASYRLRKFSRRYRAALAVTGLFVLVLLASMGLVVRESVLTRRAERAALEQLQRGEQLIQFMLNDLHGKLYSVGRLDVMESTVAQVEAFYAQSVITNLPPESLRYRAHARLQLGRIRLEQGKPGVARHHYEESIRLYEAAMARQPKEIALQEELGQAWNTLAVFHHSRMETNAAERAYHEALRWADSLMGAQPEIPVWVDFKASTLQNFAALCEALGRTDEAEKNYTDALRLWEPLHARTPGNVQLLDHVSQVYQNLAFLQGRLDQWDKVERSNAKALELREQLVALETNNVRAIEMLADIQQNIADVCFNRGRLAEAEEWINRYLPHRERLANHDPANAHWQSRLADAWRNFARLQARRGHLEAAAEAHRKGWEISERKLPPEESERSERAKWLAGLRAADDVFASLAKQKHEQGNFSGSLQHWESVVEIRAKLANETLTNAPLRHDLALACLESAAAALGAGHGAPATQHAQLGLLLLVNCVKSGLGPKLEDQHWKVLHELTGVPARSGTAEGEAGSLLTNGLASTSAETIRAALEMIRWPAALSSVLRQQASRHATDK